jgi:isoquinoline 1-oxidoreductase beta subunit
MTRALTRREFIQVSALATGGMMITLTTPVAVASSPPKETDTVMGPYLKIFSDGLVEIGGPVPELGQGVHTSLPMILAEELDVDWDQVRVVQAPIYMKTNADGRVELIYGRQHAGGSHSIRRQWPNLRRMGATARAQLIKAAAQRWGIDDAQLTTQSGAVWHEASGRRLGYGELAAAAAEIPLSGDVALKPADQFRLVGRDHSPPHMVEVVTGKPIFGIDATLPGMLHATIERCPYLDGEIASLDDSAALAVPGVRHVVRIERPPLDQYYRQLAAGIAVVADNAWSARRGRRALANEWTRGPHHEESTESFDRQCEELLAGQGQIVRDEGDCDAALSAAANTIEATYAVPFVSHAQLEPGNCTVQLDSDRCLLIGSYQVPHGAAAMASSLTGLPVESIEVRARRCGGAFGRRLSNDFVAEAVMIAQAVGKPVQLTWSREDDIQHDFYRPAGHHHMRAGVDADGRVVAWTQRLASASKYYRRPGLADTDMWRSELYPDDFPSRSVPNFRLEYFPVKSGMPRGSWRAPGHTANCFAIQSFIDEIARQTGQDPLQLQLQMLGEPRELEYNDYGGPTFSTGRYANVLKLAAEKANWGQPLGQNRGRGIAAEFTFGTYVAEVVEVEVSPRGELTVTRVVAAIDCGRPVNPDGIRAQVEGGVNDALSVALGQAITVEAGRIQQSNFHDYRMMRIDQAPREIETYIVEGDAEPTGMGEPPVPPLAPALCNAIAAATGKRIRKLPIADQLS